MNNSTFLDYAEANGLRPVAWFDINYPAYAVKVRYMYPTSNPADFRDRALLQLIDIGVSYPTACAILMIDDPHESILKRFKSDVPQLVQFDKELNRLALTEIGKQKVERIELARNGVSSCLVDGFTGLPFPKDVVKYLSNGFSWKDASNISGGIYPFEPSIEQKIIELNTKINECKGDKFQYRLGIPDKAKETSMTPLGTKWMTNLSMGIFLKDTEIVRRIFCDNVANPISPFGWLINPNILKITQRDKTSRFSLKLADQNNSDVFDGISFDDLQQMIAEEIEQEYGSEFIKSNEVNVNADTGLCVFRINTIDAIAKGRERLLSAVNKGFLPLQLKGMNGSLFVSLQPDSKISALACLRAKIDESRAPWEDIISELKEKYPASWRQTLITIGRHDLLFRHDVTQYIKTQYIKDEQDDNILQ